MSEEATKENITDTLPSPANETLNPVEGNPWDGIIGIFKDDPAWDAVMAHIYEQRRLDRNSLDDVKQDCDHAEGADAMSKQAIKEEPKEKMPSSAHGLPPMDVTQKLGEPIKDHPLAKVFGVFEDNPMLDVMIENMREYRRKVDEEEAARQDSNAE